MQPKEETRPHTLPLPRHTPSIKVDYSRFYIESVGQKLVIPCNLFARTALLSPLKVRQAICVGCDADDCLEGWPSVRPNDVYVLKLNDYNGNVIYGWYVRFQVEPFRFIRVPKPLVAKLFLKLHNDERLSKSSLHQTVVDVVLIDRESRFEELLRRTLLCMNLTQSKKRKRSKTDQDTEAPRSELSPVLSAPSSPKRNMEDCCSLCLEEVEVFPSNCCGLSGGTCRTCNDKVRGLCTLCDRRTLTCAHECDRCRNRCTFQESAYPCSACGEPRVCVSCHSEFSVCRVCIDKVG
jgi:hypothetical protein